MEAGPKLQFLIKCSSGNSESHLELSQYDTVETLKTKIYELLDIPSHEQVIEGWKYSPDDDDTLLETCSDLSGVTQLVVKDTEINTNHREEDEDLEIESSISFIDKILNKYDNSSVQFHSCRLQDAITEACMAPLVKRKALCLYLHNESQKFSSAFCENLNRAEVVEILNRSFFFLGYDVEVPKYQSALIRALHETGDLSNLVTMVNSKVAAALCIVPIKDSVTVFCCIRGRFSPKDFLMALSNAENFLILENQQEQNLEELSIKTRSDSDIGSVNYQRLMADMLGDRDYDRFDADQHEYLKKKIAFALLGPPQKEEGYEKKDLKKVQSLLESIVSNANEVAKYRDTLEISFIYNCTEPLPSEKISRAKKYQEYNPNTDVMPLPVFVLRKCRGSSNPCRVFVDNIGRSYATWNEYIIRNKLHQCEMILPQNGRYEVDENGAVLLERHISPACGVDTKLLHGADYLSTAGGLISGGIFIAAAIPAIAVAPAALIAGGVIGLGAGIYSISRSAYTLYDRKRHKETLNFANSKARGAYLNILAGSLGFVGVGATMAVSQLASAGVNIGQGAGAAINTIGFVNIGASGVSMLHSGYDVIDHWYNENRAASLLTMVQLRSSVLFFGNVVYNFDTDSKIIDETQATVLQNYQQSLRDNRYRKPLLLDWKRAIRQQADKQINGKVEIVMPIYKIPDNDEILNVLRRTEIVDYSESGGDIKVGGMKINIEEFVNMNKKTFTVVLSNSSQLDKPEFIRDIILNILQTVPDIESLTSYVVKILNGFSGDTKTKIIMTLAKLLDTLSTPTLKVLDKIFPNQFKIFHLLDVILIFFGKAAQVLWDQYKMWADTRKDNYYSDLFDGIEDSKADNVLHFLPITVNSSFDGTRLTEKALQELLSCFYDWFGKQVYDFQVRGERNAVKQEFAASYPTEKVSCSVCDGYYYRLRKKS